MHYLNEQNIFIFLVQIFLLLGSARLLGELFRKWKQPPLTAEIIVGLIFGPTIFGRFLPGLHLYIFPQNIIQHNMLETVGWIGIFFLLLETGLETDFLSAWRQKGEAFRIAITDIIVPMLLAFTVSMLLPIRFLVDPAQRISFSLFMAIALTISAMPVSARILHDLDLSKTDLGFLIISALSINDIIGWLLFTIILGYATHADPEIFKVFIILASTIGFTAICLTFGRRFANAVILRIKERKLPEPASSLTFICLLGAFCGAITQKIGIHALLGFFIAGIMAGGAEALSERTRQIISQMVYALIVPIFFVNIGLKLDFIDNFDLFLVLFVTIVGIGGRFLGAWMGVNPKGVLKQNRLSIAIAHSPGGAMEIVVGLVALEYNIISGPIFIAIVCGAVISTIIVGPWLELSLKRRKEISISEFFLRRAIIPSLNANSRDTAIYELCEVVYDHEDFLGFDGIYSEVIGRENAMGTAVEEGIAFPHARFSALGKPVIAFGRSLTGIDWDSPDGIPAQFIFLVLTPRDAVGTQVQILSIIARAMKDAATRNAILQAKDSLDIWEILNTAIKKQSIMKKKK